MKPALPAACAAAAILAVMFVSVQPSVAEAVPQTVVSAGVSGAPADAKAADSESDARVIAQLYGHPVGVDSETSPTLLVSALPDGSMQAESDVVPARALQNGTWVAEDTSLAPVSAGWVAPRVAAAPVQFSTGGSAVMAQVQAPGGAWLTQSWPYGNLPTPSVSGSSVVYADVFPGVDCG
ncbi:hypothetical protein [Rathayibacter soli]|uniref:hypothetical protein n=1 Tax=Rathayibacter soli TaxID=3144168 RepID=UPI0027E4088F|nr:hypothetical protein [Glaciibacter superstes]